ncbi:MAG TPA: GIY-YIG nuclease family protein [Pseudolabrys sp.]|jgi:putative endonuclease|nr:GIY-YIG nuclease family protein [Pseudolabrys sp.]
MDCFVYVLGTITGTRRLTYVGWTNDVPRRLAQHNAGKGARFTRGRTWVLLHFERCVDRRDAMSREWHLKRDRDFRKKLAATLGVPGRKRRRTTGKRAAT